MKTLGNMVMIAMAAVGPQREARAADSSTALPYSIVDTGQVRSYDDRAEISYPSPGAAFFGQDAQYDGNQPSYRDNGDGTVTDLNTGLTWQADPGTKKTFAQAVAGATACRTGGYEDWRLPAIKELYSLILFSGTDPDPSSRQTRDQTPFLDTQHFRFRYGRASDGDRIIDSQYASATRYVSTTMNGNPTMFGVNFADGRIKGYPIDRDRRGRTKTFYVLYVRGNPAYGRNDLVDNGDGSVTDRATGLTWMQIDSAALRAGRNRDGKLNWAEALQWAEDLEYAGHDDWRLPNAKELHSIVDYTRSPDTSSSAAIDPVFDATPITNEGGKSDYGHYWTSTSHTRVRSAGAAVYVAFGRGLGFMSDPRMRSGEKKLLDVHGAGAQRADLKAGDPTRIPQGRGPQGDVMRIDNLVRCIRGGTAQPRDIGPKLEMVYSGAPHGDGPPSGADFVRRLDRNADGKISRSEFDGPADHFGRFDRNRDGYISSDEAPTGPPPRDRRPPER
jgi:hypothetical protein